MRNVLAQNFFLLLFLGLSFGAFAQKAAPDTANSKGWRLSAEWFSYRSFSQQKQELPMKASYPALVSHSLLLRGGFTARRPKSRHTLAFALSLPAYLGADNGKGENHLLQKNQSSYFRAGFDYRLSFRLFGWKKFHARHALLSGLLFESRHTEYLSGAAEKATDANLYLGPGISLQYGFSEKWAVKGKFDGRFYLPHLNFGRLRSSDAQGREFFSSVYRAFYYQAVFDVSVACRLGSQKELQAGVIKNDLVGFANTKPLFYIDNLVHFKMDRLLHVYFRYKF